MKIKDRTTMTTFYRSVTLLSILLSLLLQECHAEEEKVWSVDLNTDFYSDYMFRGVNLYDGTSIQPSATLSYSFGEYGSLGAVLWAHLSAEGDRQAEKFTELDETISYDVTLGPAAITLGTVWYTYPDSSDEIADTAEVFASTTFDTVLSPRIAIYEDYREFDNQYYELGFSHELTSAALGEGFNITPYVTFGFATNADKAYADNSGLVQITYGVSSDVSLGDISLTPNVNYTSKVDDATVNEFWFGLSVGYSL